MGGMVALDWAARHPADFDRVVVLNSSTANLAWPWERMRPGAALSVCRALLLGPLFGRGERDRGAEVAQ